ncbi:MAG: phosphoadenylyl-sulfate reductase [Bacteroidetes bacterium]|nr:phosphoadenylyl-sulfate reductase [Bacteroidota bacterium]
MDQQENHSVILEEVLPKPLREKISHHLDYEGDLHDPDHLNAVFTPLSFRERIHLLYAYFKQEEVLLTSSFGTNSAFLLYLVSQMRPTQPVHFIDTLFHFPETINYKNTLADFLNIRVIDVLPAPEDHERSRDQQLWKAAPDACCGINKVQPLDKVKRNHKIWFSGVLGFQTAFRAGLNVFEKQGDILKFHPLVDITEEQFLKEYQAANLPEHPLKACGFGSVGCTHCTQKGEGRSGRWAEKDKSECGLHPGYFDKK